jgi:hypothetical protein
MDLSSMKIIETNYDGHRFRSRTEARWAVFFKTAGIQYEYEKEGVVVDGKPYLPDFWLNEMKLWMEIKGTRPTPDEHKLCELLAVESGYGVMLAVGAPKPEGQIFWFPTRPNHCDGELYYIADDRRNENEFWLMSEGGSGVVIGPASGPNHGREPLVHSASKAGYEAAKTARFEHGEQG